MWPLMWHFSGQVVQVFGTAQRSKPSLDPLRAALVLFAMVITLPYMVEFLPMLVLLLVVWLWLRRRGWIRGRLPRFSNHSASDTSLAVTSFRVRLSCGEGETDSFREIDCRLVQRADRGPSSVVGGERVIGRGRRTGQGVVEVSRLQMLDNGRILHSTSPKSRVSVFASASLVVAAGAVMLYVQWEQIPPVDFDGIVSLLGIVLGFLLLIQMMKIAFRRIF